MENVFVFVEDGSVQQVASELPKCWRNISGLDALSPDELVEVGWFEVSVPAAVFDPDTQFASDVRFVVEGGLPVATYDVAEISGPSIARRLADAIERAAARIEACRDAGIALGFRATIDAENFWVQTRDERDFRNLTGLVQRAMLLHADGVTAPVIAFRDDGKPDERDDEVHNLTPTQMIDLGNQAGDHVSAWYAASWPIKTTMRALPTPSAIDAFDAAAAAGWPGD